jgi:hypothetical protein
MMMIVNDALENAWKGVGVWCSKILNHQFPRMTEKTTKSLKKHNNDMGPSGRESKAGVSNINQKC